MNDVGSAVPDLYSYAELQRLRQGLIAMLRSELRSNALAEDLCNETFRVVLERLRDQPLQEPDKLAAFLAQTARNLARAAKRAIHRQKTDTGQQAAIEEVEDPNADPTLASQADAQARAVKQVLREIPHARDRQILVRTYLYEEDRAEICGALGIDETHYRRVISRARARFRELLDKRFRVSDLYGLALV
jgi:RNA polymerase sigma-70 factor (ECF subfamily)